MKKYFEQLEKNVFDSGLVNHVLITDPLPYIIGF